MGRSSAVAALIIPLMEIVNLATVARSSPFRYASGAGLTFDPQLVFLHSSGTSAITHTRDRSASVTSSMDGSTAVPALTPRETLLDADTPVVTLTSAAFAHLVFITGSAVNYASVAKHCERLARSYDDAAKAAEDAAAELSK